MIGDGDCGEIGGGMKIDRGNRSTRDDVTREWGKIT
jgi:hypothetical protein